MPSEILVQGYWDAAKVKVFQVGKHEPSPEVAEYARVIWDEVLLKHPQLFSGLMLRLKNWQVTESLELEMELTDFALYLATRDPEFDKRFPNELRADPQGMNLATITSDDKVIVTRRSLNSEHNPGTLNFIGGYVDPPAAGETQIDLSQQAKRELLEELNIQPEQVAEITVRGLGYDPYVHHPELFLVVRLNVDSQTVAAGWQQARDAHEANQVLFVDRSDLLHQNQTNTLPYPPCWSFSTGMELL